MHIYAALFGDQGYLNLHILLLIIGKLRQAEQALKSGQVHSVIKNSLLGCPRPGINIIFSLKFPRLGMDIQGILSTPRSSLLQTKVDIAFQSFLIICCRFLLSEWRVLGP